jgi:hypothetical protein
VKRLYDTIKHGCETKLGIGSKSDTKIKGEKVVWSTCAYPPPLTQSMRIERGTVQLFM